jgi:hypothetical protein
MKMSRNFVKSLLTFLILCNTGRIRDPDKNYSGSRFLGVKKGPDPRSRIRNTNWIRIRMASLIRIRIWNADLDSGGVK